jgi:hypothetical protein
MFVVVAFVLFVYLLGFFVCVCLMFQSVGRFASLLTYVCMYIRFEFDYVRNLTQ